MRRPTPLAVLAGVLILFACEAVTPTAFDDPGWPAGLNLVSSIGPTCGAGTVVPLIADGTVQVGSVEVVNGESSLWVAYRTDAAWPISKTALLVVDAPNAIPTNGPGNPQVGRFDHKARHAGAHEVIWEIDLGGLTGGVVVAAFAEVGADAEGAWAGGDDGVPIREGGSWATYIVHALGSCESVEGEVGSDGGTLVLQDLAFIVPPTSLSQPTLLTIAPTSLGLQNEVRVYEFGPSGTTFDPPAQLVIDYDENALPPGVQESQLRAFIANGIFELIGDAVIDTDANEATIPVAHFSAYGLVYVDRADLQVAFPLLSEDPPRVDVPVTYSAFFSAAPASPVVEGAVGFFELTGDASLVAVPDGCTDASGAVGPDIRIRCVLDLEPGVLVPLEVEVVPHALGGTLDAAFSIAAPLSVDDPDPTNNELVIVRTTDPTGVADLRVQAPALSEDPPRVGFPVTYSAQYSAAPGSPTVPDAVASFALTGDADLVSMPPGCQDFSDFAIPDVAVVCTLTLQPGLLVPLEFGVVANAAGATLEAEFEIAPPADWEDPDPADNLVSLSTTSVGLFADLHMASSAPPVAVVGRPFDWTTTVTTLSDNVDAVDILVTPQLIAGSATVVLPAECGAFTCAYPGADPDASQVAVIEVTPTAVGGLTLSALAQVSILDDATDPDADNNLAASTVDAYLEVADVSVGLADAPDPATVGGTVGYTVSLANAADALSDASLAELLLTVDGTGAPTPVSAPAGCTDVSGVHPEAIAYQCAIPTLAAGGAADLEFEVSPGAAGALTAYAELMIPGGVLDPDQTNNTALEMTTVDAAGPVADLAMFITATLPTPLTETVEGIHPLVVRNLSLDPAATADSAVITYEPPAGFVVGTLPANCSSEPSGIRCVFLDIVADDYRQADIPITAPSAGSYTANASVEGFGNVDPDLANNVDSEPVEVAPLVLGVDLVIAAGGPMFVDANTPSRFIVSVLNGSPSTSTGAIVEVFSSDPTAQLFNGQVPAGCSDNSDAGNPLFLLCHLPDIPPGSQLPAAVEVDLVFGPAGASADLFFSILSADQPDPNPLNNETSLEVIVNP